VCIDALLTIEEQSQHTMLCSPDDLNFCSSITLFSRTDGGDERVFRRALYRFCVVRMHEQTLARLEHGTE
jgi:uncharacterized protein (DUF1810 family)